MVGARLAELREDKGLTQEEFGSLFHVGRHAIYSYEHDKTEPPDSLKIEFANYFGVTLDYLMGVSQDPHKSNKPYRIDPINRVIQIKPKLPKDTWKDLELLLDWILYKYQG